MSPEATPALMASKLISFCLVLQYERSYLEVAVVATVESMCFPLKSRDGPAVSHKNSFHMAAVVVGMLVAAKIVDGRRNAPILPAGPTFENDAQQDEVAADVRRRMVRLNSCCCKKPRLQSRILVAEGMEILESRSGRGYPGGTMKASVLAKAF